MTTTLPKPSHYGLPSKFKSWRTHQTRQILDAERSSKRFVAQCASTGSGKTLTYIAQVLRSGSTAIVLTSTKALQSQLLSDFSSIGLVEVKGKNSYPCVNEYGNVTCDRGVCNAGIKCDHRFRGTCEYYRAVSIAEKSGLVVTNYAYWVTMNLYRDGLKRPDLLILDEAHHSYDHLSNLMTFTMKASDVGRVTGLDMPKTAGERRLKLWADMVGGKASEMQDSLKPQLDHGIYDRKDDALSAARLARKAGMLSRAMGKESKDWMVESKPGVLTFCPVWPWRYAEKYLFSGIKKVLLTSATIRPKTLAILGLKDPDYDFTDYPGVFKKENRMLHYIPTVRLTHRTSDAELKVWMAQIDNIIRTRLHQKGIIHTVSYKRRDYILQNSAYSDFMVSNVGGWGRNRGKKIPEVVSDFKASDPPSILVSPSVGTGFDFPGSDCRWQIITKLPFPDLRDRLLKERMKKDKDYGSYVTMQSLVQMVGRACRSENDWAQSLLIDDNAKWFMWKFKHYAPKWFMDAYKTENTIPTVMQG